jgi:hypothetical protein
MDIVINFIKRHTLYIAIAAVCIFALSYIPGIPAMVQVLLQLPLIIGVVIILASVTLYSFTPVNFYNTPEVEKNKDGILNTSIISAHVAGKYRVMASVFLSVSLLTGVTLLAVYFLTN